MERLIPAILPAASPTAPRGKRTTAETENEDLIAFVVVFDQPLIGETDVLIEALAKHATEEPADPDFVTN